MTNERLTRIKGLPLAELSITGVASIIDVYEDDEGRQHPVIEMEVLNEADWEKFNAPKHEARRCAMCGHALKIACAVTHAPTGNGYWIGRDCANTIKVLAAYGGIIKSATVALAQRIACDKREADFLAAHPDAIGILTWAKRPNAPRICRDMCEKLRRYGNLSNNQIELLEKIRQQDIDRRSKATGKATAGRQVINGKIIKATSAPSEFGGSRWSKPPMVTKVIVDCGNGVRLMGNLPNRLILDEQTLTRLPDWARNGTYKPGNDWETHEIVKVGDMISLKATVTPSPKDDLFGFWKRPVDFKVTALAVEPAPVAPVVPAVDPAQLALAEAKRWSEIVLKNQPFFTTNFTDQAVKRDGLNKIVKEAALPAEEAERFIAAVMACNAPV